MKDHKETLLIAGLIVLLAVQMVAVLLLSVDQIRAVVVR